MTRGLPAAMVTELQSDDPKPTTLIKISTGDSGTPWIYLTDKIGGITFDSKAYVSRPFEIAESKIAAGEFPAIEISIADVDRYFDTWLLTTEFRFKKVIRKVIERDEMGASDQAISDTYRISHKWQEAHRIVFIVEPLQAILSRVRVPARTMTRDDFPGMPTEGMVR